LLAFTAITNNTKATEMPNVTLIAAQPITKRTERSVDLRAVRFEAEVAEWLDGMASSMGLSPAKTLNVLLRDYMALTGGLLQRMKVERQPATAVQAFNPHLDAQPEGFENQPDELDEDGNIIR
jgi:hypothetical protein